MIPKGISVVGGRIGNENRDIGTGDRRSSPADRSLVHASVAVAAKITEDGGGEGWGTSNGF